MLGCPYRPDIREGPEAENSPIVCPVYIESQRTDSADGIMMRVHVCDIPNFPPDCPAYSILSEVEWAIVNLNFKKIEELNKRLSEITPTDVINIIHGEESYNI
jgi:hypothetical protein